MKTIKAVIKWLFICVIFLPSLLFTAFNVDKFKAIIINQLPQVAAISSKNGADFDIKKYIDNSIAAIISDRHLQTQMSAGTALKTLSSTVRISTIGSNVSVGTGVIIKVKELKDKKIKTYIITNQHVIDRAFNVKIESFHYLGGRVIAEITTYTGKVIAKDPYLDLALIEVTSPRAIGPAVKSVGVDEFEDITLNDSVAASGCALGEPPIITNGNIVYIGLGTLIATPHAIFGNSGGGLFTIDGQLLGIVSRIGTIRVSSTVSVPDPNLTKVIPITLVRVWLELNDLHLD